uniref:Uncharacterized protein n=1 Tax=Anguilla anguilla TaxID=7936 RepID=A0A0E9U456_ANGAN
MRKRVLLCSRMRMRALLYSRMCKEKEDERTWRRAASKPGHVLCVFSFLPEIASPFFHVHLP